MLSRPWGLLSRFQQAQQIAPPRTPGRKPMQEEKAETGRPGPFDTGRKS
jgi:hypothetical protein